MEHHYPQQDNYSQLLENLNPNSPRRLWSKGKLEQVLAPTRQLTELYLTRGATQQLITFNPDSLTVNEESYEKVQAFLVRQWMRIALLIPPDDVVVETRRELARIMTEERVIDICLTDFLGYLILRTEMGNLLFEDEDGNNENGE